MYTPPPYQLKYFKVKPQTSVSLSPPDFMEEDDGDELQTPKSPFWMQTTTNLSRIQRYRRRISSLFFNSFVLIIFLLVFAVVSMVFIIPSLIHRSSNVFRPNLVKRSWDSINLVLVVIALVFGFLSRSVSDDDDESKLNFDNGFDRSESELPSGAPINPIMYDLQDQSMNSAIGLRRQKTSISYPDLRELSPLWNHRAAEPWRFSDDTHLNYYRVLESDRNSLRQRSRREYNSGNQDVDDPNLHTPTPRLPPSPPPQTPNTVKQKKNRVHRNVAVDDGERNRGSGTGTESSEQKGARDEKKRSNTEKRRARSSEPKKILSPEPSSPPPVLPSTERKTNNGNAKKDFFISFHHKKKKKRQRDRSVDNLNALIRHSQPPAVKFQPPAPPPPPPPPAVRHHLFPNKKENRKKFISIPLPPPPPPPPRTAIYAPPPPRATVTRVAPFVTDKPGAFLMTNVFSGIDDSSSGGESPMKRIPPPPPLPPFKMPDWKFAVEGDFVRLQSALSSTSVSPDGDEARSPSSDVDATATATATGVFPDVDTKADSFIATFRAGLKLERMSKLGPGPGSGPIDN